LPDKQGIDEPDSRCGIPFGQRTVTADGSAEVWELRMHIDPVWRPWPGNLSEAKAPVESIKIIFSPAAPIPPHPFQQLSITIGHATLPLSKRRKS
jgi:hypothetical protein